MGIALLRTSQTAEFVHTSDETAIPGQKAPDPDWLVAAGQPASCDRFKVRALSASEYAEIGGITPGPDAPPEQRRAAQAAADAAVCAKGWLALNGAPPPTDLGFGWARQVARLIEVLTLDGPFGGSRLRSAASLSEAPHSGQPSGEQSAAGAHGAAPLTAPATADPASLSTPT